LNSYGVNEEVIMWVSAFLSNRSQRVDFINGTKSKWVKVLPGKRFSTGVCPCTSVVYYIYK